MDRIVFLGTPINDDVANIIIAQMLFLEADNPERDIYLYINSPGGSVSAGLAIYDTMQFLKSPVNTICMGMAASMGSFLLAGGPQGQAVGAAAFAHHDPPALRGAAAARRPTSRSRRKEILYLRAQAERALRKHTGRPIEQIERDMDRDFFMSAEEAKDYGIIDNVITQRGEIVEPSDAGRRHEVSAVPPWRWLSQNVRRAESSLA